MRDITPYEKRFFGGFNPFGILGDFERQFWQNSSCMFYTDIRDKGNAYELEAELPGFQKDEIDIQAENNTLTIRVQKKSGQQEDSGGYIRRERAYGSCCRSFDITGIKAENITASYENGILLLTLPKEQEQKASPRKIQLS